VKLERAIAGLKPHPQPKVWLEQYTIPPDVASELLFTATYIYGDIPGKTVIDLGCGTGRLTIGAAMLGADLAVGVDVDPVAVRVAVENSELASVSDRVRFVVADVSAVRGRFDCVLMNPPFGVRRRHMDVEFLRKAVQLSDTVYSIHKASTIRYVSRWLGSRGWRVDAALGMKLRIPKMFRFHEKRFHSVDVAIIRAVRE